MYLSIYLELFGHHVDDLTIWQSFQACHSLTDAKYKHIGAIHKLRQVFFEDFDPPSPPCQTKSDLVDPPK